MAAKIGGFCDNCMAHHEDYSDCPVMLRQVRDDLAVERDAAIALLRAIRNLKFAPLFVPKMRVIERVDAFLKEHDDES